MKYGPETRRLSGADTITDKVISAGGVRVWFNCPVMEKCTISRQMKSSIGARYGRVPTQHHVAGAADPIVRLSSPSSLKHAHALSASDAERLMIALGRITRVRLISSGRALQRRDHRRDFKLFYGVDVKLPSTEWARPGTSSHQTSICHLDMNTAQRQRGSCTVFLTIPHATRKI